MGSTGVDASIPGTEAWTLQVSSKHPEIPGEMLETGSHWLSVGTLKLGETFRCHLAAAVPWFFKSLVWLGAGAPGLCVPGASR